MGNPKLFLDFKLNKILIQNVGNTKSIYPQFAQRRGSLSPGPFGRAKESFYPRPHFQKYLGPLPF